MYNFSSSTTTPEEDKEILKAISAIKRKWKRALLDKFEVLLIKHGSSQEIKLDLDITHSGVFEKKFRMDQNKYVTVITKP